MAVLLHSRQFIISVVLHSIQLANQLHLFPFNPYKINTFSKIRKHSILIPKLHISTRKRFCYLILSNRCFLSAVLFRPTPGRKLAKRECESTGTY